MNKRTYCIDPKILGYKKEAIKNFEILSFDKFKKELSSQPAIKSYAVLDKEGNTVKRTYIKEIRSAKQFNYFKIHIKKIFEMYRDGLAITIDLRRIWKRG